MYPHIVCLASPGGCPDQMRTPGNGRRDLTLIRTDFCKRPALSTQSGQHRPNPDISTSSAPGIEVDVSKPLEFEHLLVHNFIAPLIFGLVLFYFSKAFMEARRKLS